MTLDVIINVNNKEKTIESTYNKLEDELKDIKHNLIFIDNSSTDKSLEILKNIQVKNDLCVKIISLSKKHDKDTCIYAGLLHTKHSLVCIYDMDLNIQISQISKMYDYISKHKEYDQVCIKNSYDEENFIKKTKLKLFNKLYGLNYDYNISYFRIMNRNVVNAIIEYTKIKAFSIYTFYEIGFNTYYIKTDNKKIDLINYKKLIEYSNYKKRLLNLVNLILLILSFIYLILILFKLFNVSNNTLLLFIFITNILNFYLYNLINNKSKEKTYFIIKEKIGFEDNVL